MKVFLPHNRILKLKENINVALNIEFVAEVLGLLVSSLLAVQYGALHYRDLKKDKTKAYKYIIEKK